MPNRSTFTSVPTIAERSEATPGLWNRIYSVVSQNIDQLNLDVGSGALMSPITPTSGNTVQVNANLDVRNLSVFTGLTISNSNVTYGAALLTISGRWNSTQTAIWPYPSGIWLDVSNTTSGDIASPVTGEGSRLMVLRCQGINRFAVNKFGTVGIGANEPARNDIGIIVEHFLGGNPGPSGISAPNSTNQFGIFSIPTIGSDATGGVGCAVAGQLRPYNGPLTSPSSAGSYTDMFAFYAFDFQTGQYSGWTIGGRQCGLYVANQGGDPNGNYSRATTAGVYIENQNTGTPNNRYGLFIGTMAGASGNSLWAIYTSTATVSLGGNLEIRGNSGVGIGQASVSSDRALGIGSTGLSGITQYGIVVAPSFPVAATAAGIAGYFNANVANAPFTQTVATGVYIASTTKGAAATLTNNYGLFIESQTAANSVNFAILTRTGTVGFGDTVVHVAGTASAPSMAFSSETSLGWFRSAASGMALSYGTLALPNSQIRVGADVGGTTGIDVAYNPAGSTIAHILNRYSAAGASAIRLGFGVPADGLTALSLTIGSGSSLSGLFGIGVAVPSAELHVSGRTVRIQTGAGVAFSGTAPGNIGDIAWGVGSGTTFLYVCTSANSWHRATLNPF